MTLRRLAPGEMPWSSNSPALPDVSQIVDAVRAYGDAAVAGFAREFGDPPPRRVPADEIDAALQTVDAALLSALRSTAQRIARFAMAQRDALADVAVETGGMIAGHRALPVARAGIYVPAGRYPLASTLLMCAIPARIAGVREIVVCTPRVCAATLAAAREAGVERCFEVGGAQAIAAMAYGTRLVPRVDVIAGPGNAYVTAAKRAVFGDCGIDMLAGPSELAIVASGGADPALVAADLLAQAEHDERARVLLLTGEERLAQAVETELRRQLHLLPNPATAAEALRRQGCCAIVPIERAADLVNAVAPEHLALHGRDAEALEPRLHAYGSLFAGAAAAEVFGDYGAGPNHVLPTASTARFSSGLSVLTFLKLRTYLRAAAGIEQKLVDEAAELARAEGLFAHEASALLRSSNQPEGATSRLTLTTLTSVNAS